MASLRQIWVSVFIIGLFVFAALSFLYGFVEQNNPSSPVVNNAVFNGTYTSLNNTLMAFQGAVQQQQNITQSDRKASSVSIFLILDSFLVVPFNMMNLAFSLMTIISSFLFVQIFGGSAYIVFTVLIGILTGTVLFLVMKFVRTGETER